MLIIGGFSLYKEYRTLKTEASRATMFQVTIAARTLGHWTHTQLDTLTAIANLPDIANLNQGACKKIMATALKAQTPWTELTLVTPAGEPILSTEPIEPETRKAIAGQLTGTKFFGTVVNRAKPAFSDYMRSPFGRRDVLLAGAPVMKNGKVQAVLLASVDPRAVLGLFKGLGEDKGTVIAIVDSNKRVIVRTLQAEYWQGKDFSHAKTVQAASRTPRGTIEIVGIADPTSRSYAFDHLADPPWMIEVGVPTDAIYGAAHDWLGIMMVLGGCGIGVSFILAYWATTHFTRVIHILVREALAIGRGDFSKRVHDPYRDELGLLARAFNQMAERLELDQDQKQMIERISESIRQSLDLEQILNTAVHELGEALGASRCCLALLDTNFTEDKSDDELVFNYVWWNEKIAGSPLKNRSIRVTENSVMSMILEQGSILSLDVLDDKGPTPLFDNALSSPDDWRTIRSLVACPISTNEGPLGLILVHQCDRLRVWSESELELVDNVARHVTLAMQHAELYNRTKRMADQEILINQIVRSVRGSLDLDTILGAVTRELLKALGVERVQIAQPRTEGPLVVTHEYHLPSMHSCSGMNMYPDQMDFHPNMGFASFQGGQNSLLGIDLDIAKEHALKESTDETETHWLQSMDSPTAMIQPMRKADMQTSTARKSDALRAAQSTTVHEAPLAVIGNVFEDSRAIPFKDFLDQVGSQSLIAAPLLNENELVGLLMVHQCSKMRTWKPTDIQLVAAIADQVAIAITHAHLFAQVRHQAITDGLTGLYNHIYFKNRLAEELRLAQRKGTQLSLLMIDLDKLKWINDSFGHPVGDAAIRQIANILKTLLRSGDTAARYGGEEFGIILPETSLLEAALIADRLCSQIRSNNVPGLGRVTASIGAACYPKHAGDMHELIDKADKALYIAKNNGRDQVRIYENDNVAHPVNPAANPNRDEKETRPL